MRILSKVLVVCAIFLAGCAPDRDAATNRFISQGTLALQGTENRDEISYWNGTGSEGEPRIVIDLDQQRAYFYKGDQLLAQCQSTFAVRVQTPSSPYSSSSAKQWSAGGVSASGPGPNPEEISPLVGHWPRIPNL
jgi:hypothetical protein